jgi:hypothetical protein
LTEWCPDDTPIELVVPVDGDDWRRIGLDVSVRESFPTAVVIEADEGMRNGGSVAGA